MPTAEEKQEFVLTLNVQPALIYSEVKALKNTLRLTFWSQCKYKMQNDGLHSVLLTGSEQQRAGREWLTLRREERRKQQTLCCSLSSTGQSDLRFSSRSGARP